MKKKIFCFFLFCVFSFFLFGTEIENIELYTIVDGHNILLTEDVIPDFKNIKKPIIENTEVPIDDKPTFEIVEQTQVEVIEDNTVEVDKSEKNTQKQNNIICATTELFHPGVWNLNLCFDYKNAKLPFMLGFKKNTLYVNSSRSDLDFFGKINYSPLQNLNLFFGFDYLAQVLDLQGATLHRFEFVLGSNYEFNNWSLSFDSSLVFCDEGVYVPFEIASKFQIDKIKIGFNGGIKSRAADIVFLSTKNAKTDFNDLCAEESFFFVNANSKLQLDDTFAFLFMVEYQKTIFDNGFVSPLSDFSVQIINRHKVNSSLSFIADLSKVNFALTWNAFWLDKKYMDLPHELNFYVSFMPIKKIKIDFGVIDIIQMLRAKAGGFTLSGSFYF